MAHWGAVAPKTNKSCSSSLSNSVKCSVIFFHLDPDFAQLSIMDIDYKYVRRSATILISSFRNILLLHVDRLYLSSLFYGSSLIMHHFCCCVLWIKTSSVTLRRKCRIKVSRNRGCDRLLDLTGRKKREYIKICLNQGPNGLYYSMLFGRSNRRG